MLPVLRFFAGITPPEELHRIGKAEGKGASGKTHLGMPPFQKSAVFLNIVQKAFDPPPLLFEHLSYFAGGVF